MSGLAPVARGERGFGLVETLIAVAIIAVMMAMTFTGIAANARITGAIADRRAAVLVAQSALDMAVAGGGGPGSPRAGESGPLRWQVAIEPYGAQGEGAGALDLVTVTVTRLGSAAPLLRLRTLRIGR